VQLDLNLVVLEDRAYGMIRWKQEVDKADLPDSAQYVRCRGGGRTSSFHNV
jgi:thiamine pyrophosphate-dependent acetolactate synthase large subunit-like protein